MRDQHARLAKGPLVRKAAHPDVKCDKAGLDKSGLNNAPDLYDLLRAGIMSFVRLVLHQKEVIAPKYGRWKLGVTMALNCGPFSSPPRTTPSREVLHWKFHRCSEPDGMVYT